MSVSLVVPAALVLVLLSSLFLQRLFFPFFWTDLFFLLKVLRCGARLELYRLTGNVRTVVERFVQQARRVPNKPFIVYGDDVHTYRDVELRSNRLAQVFLHRVRLRTGDCVALLMNNEPDFLCAWFGLSKLGCPVAFLNTNIRSQSLLHCVSCCRATTLVVGKDLLDSLQDILPRLLDDDIRVWAMTEQGELAEWARHQQIFTLLDHIHTVSDRPVPAAPRSATSIKAPTLYIFTSGTTGLPKAAVITHLQSLKAASGFWTFGGGQDDVIYCPLPLYHSAASLIGIGGTVELAATCVLKKKFSASHFWSDCRKHHVTIFQYIGELCRYLCNQPQTEQDHVHSIRMGVGNGLRQDVWREFLRRFGNIKMCEVYGSTEGNLCFLNHVGKIGTVGRSNFFYRLLFKYELVKYDMVKDEPVKDHNGFCRRVDTGETGLLLSKVGFFSPFFGYAGSKMLTERKLLRNVLVKGDAYFNTGDLMAEDHEGFICFKDRVGDTYRWKGENVATTEVTETLGLVDFIQEVNVYGVEVPGHEGRAGMAAVILRPEMEFNGRKLFQHAVRDLPPYARPLFIRLQETLEMTSTFKQQKFHLVQSGFNPSRICDPVYVLDQQQQSYVPLTEAVYQDIASGLWKL